MNQRAIFTTTDGNVSVVVPAPGVNINEELAKLTARGDIQPVDIPEIVLVTDLPYDPKRIFRNAWKRGEQGRKVGVEMVKAKDITHTLRRAKREVELAPYDTIIAKQIPGSNAAAAEQARAAIRDRYVVMQTSIDACGTPEDLKAIIDAEGL